MWIIIHNNFILIFKGFFSREREVTLYAFFNFIILYRIIIFFSLTVAILIPKHWEWKIPTLLIRKNIIHNIKRD